MKDRDLILHRMCELAKATKELKKRFPDYYSAQDYLGTLEVQMGEEGFLEMFPDAKDFKVRSDGTYELYTIVDGVRFFALTDEVAP